MKSTQRFVYLAAILVVIALPTLAISGWCRQCPRKPACDVNGIWLAQSQICGSYDALPDCYNYRNVLYKCASDAGGKDSGWTLESELVVATSCSPGNGSESQCY
jgi:hypothetical protein